MTTDLNAAQQLHRTTNDTYQTYD